MFNRAKLTTGITLAGSILKEEIVRITSKSGKGGYPKAIPESITLGTAKVDNDTASIEIFSEDRGNNNVVLTLAFELGAKPHRIPKEGNTLLRIPRSRWPKYQPPPDDDPLFFMHVNHPGMQPRKFLSDALNNVSGKMLDAIGDNFEVTILDGPKVEIIR